MCRVCDGFGRQLTANQAKRYDPTQTTQLRQRFEGELSRRFRKLKGSINRHLVDQDALGLRVNFAFPRSAAKVAQFMEWLKDQQRVGILEVTRGGALSRAGETTWMTTYIQSAYQKGLARSANRLRAAGADVAEDWVARAVTRPFHADRAGLLYTRAFADLEGITAVMDQQISRVLTQGLIEGRGARDLAKLVNDRVDKIGITRARMLARTETIRAHAEGSLNTYEEAQVLGVELEAEFATAQDSSVCPECEAAAKGGPYTLAEARGMVPLHPNCRCAWLPIVGDPRSVTLR